MSYFQFAPLNPEKGEFKALSRSFGVAQGGFSSAGDPLEGDEEDEALWDEGTCVQAGKNGNSRAGRDARAFLAITESQSGHKQTLPCLLWGWG